MGCYILSQWRANKWNKYIYSSMPRFPSPLTSTCRNMYTIQLHTSHIPPDPNAAIHNFSCCYDCPASTIWQALCHQQGKGHSSPQTSCLFDSFSPQILLLFSFRLSLHLLSACSLVLHSSFWSTLTLHIVLHFGDFFPFYNLFSCNLSSTPLSPPLIPPFQCCCNHRPNGCRYQAIYLCQSGYSSL